MDSRIDIPHSDRRGWLAGAAGRALPGLALCAAGVVMLWLARGQPAWLGGQVGPGLMAQLLGKGVIALGALWALWRAVSPEPGGVPAGGAGCGAGDGAVAGAQRWSGPALLGAVLAFALTLPGLGLVAAAMLAAGLAAWGAGERSAAALGLMVAGLGVLTGVIGVMLLPPTAPLWPAPWRAF
ncbi:MAG: hypothetical protein ACXIUV_03840 [Alkalilacustris sp.]